MHSRLPAAVSLTLILSILFGGCSSHEPGSAETGLSPCPSSPNCVISINGDERHGIDPLEYTSDRKRAVTHLLEILQGLDRVKIITHTPGYIHAEFTSRIFRFTDDVEFWLPEEKEGIIHLRSASRLGYSDLGVNRKRMEMIRGLFNEKQGK